MNLALHGFLLQVFLSILNLQHGSVLCSAGEPGYLDFDNLPDTNFSCQGKVIGGYYADVEAGCQMFHVCTIGQKDEIMDIKFLCLNGTVFDQETRVCERVDEVDCSKSERFYNLNLELYGNNAVTLSLHENSEDDIDPLDSIDDHPQRTTSARPSTTTTTTTTTSKPNKPSTTPASSTFSHPAGYPQHFQPQPPFPQVHTSQSKSLYDDKNGGYHHQYIFHNGEMSNNQQATSYQLFSNQGVSSTTVQPPQVHQIRFSSTSSPQIIHNEPSTVSPLFHATSSTIQTLLSNNGNGPALINPIFHNHGIASTTEQFNLHNNNPRETSEYRESGEHSIRPLEAVHPISKGKVSKLTISPVPTPSEPQRSVQTKISQTSQQQRISFLPTPATDETTVRSFYPTLRSVSKPTQSSQSTSEQVTQHIHVLPPVPIPQLKPHQITINLPPPDIQRIVQNPSPLLPSQSRVIVTAKASVSDESGRPLNTTQLVTLPLPTIPASYDDYKEGDESFDPFYRDVPKIRNARRVAVSKTSLRIKRSVGQTKNSMVSFVYGGDRPKRQEVQMVDINDKDRDKKKKTVEHEPSDFQAIKESLMKFRDILFGGEFNEDTIRNVFEGSSLHSAEAGKVGGKASLEDLETKASKNFKASREYEDSEYDGDSKDSKGDDAEYSEGPSKVDTKESDAEEYVDFKGNEEEAESTDSKEENSKEEDSKEVDSKEEDSKEVDSKEEDSKEEDFKEVNSKEEDSKEEDFKEEDAKDEEKKEVDADGVKHVEGKRVIDIVILDPNEYIKMKSSTEGSLDSATEENPTTTDASILSPTEQTTQSTLADIELTKKKDSNDSEVPGDEVKGSKHSSKYSNEKLDEVNTRKPSKKVEDKKKEESNEESKTHKSKERGETKPNAKRKSSRIRSFSGKIASRKDPKSGEVEAQTEKPSEPTDEEKIVTTTPGVEFEIEQIDKHIFDEPESQTSKEVDTRAVGHQGYAKSLQGGKDHGVEKDNRKGDANEYGTLNKQVESLAKDEDEHEEKHEEKNEEGHEEKHVEKTTVSSLNDDIEKEDEKPVEESVKVKERLSKKEKHYYREKSSIESIDDESDTDASDEETKNSEETKDSEEFKDSEKTPVLKTGSRGGKSMKFETSKEVVTHRQDKSRKFSDDDEEKDFQEYSTIKGEEVTSQEVSSEYHDSTESFYDSSHEIGTENDYKDSTTKTDYEEDSTSREDTVEENDEDELDDDHEDSTEGVLKYTDELPKEKKEELSDSKKSSDSVENSAHDYVDDNYEPDNYKEMEAAKEEEKKKKKIKDEVGKSEESSGGQVEVTTKSSDTEAEKEDEKKSKDSSGDHLQQTTSTTTTTIRTTTTTTTTVKPTPPKLFKPISIRKTYTYTPPTTTPNPVVIKPRISLLNPKPAKPPRSYNELAPKPVIRKFTLLTRKATTTLPTITVTDEDTTETTEVPVMMTDIPVALTEAPVTTTEARSEENILEVKLEQEKSPAKEPMQKDQPLVKNEGDQDSSPSEQKSPPNIEKEEGPSSTESFTPYPLTRLSNLASTIRETLKEIESTTEQTTTTKNYTLIELEVISTTVPPLATTASEPEREEATTLTVMQQDVSTETTTNAHQDSTETSTKAHQDSTETSLAPEPSPETSTQTTTTETVLSSSKEPEEVVSTTSRYSNRRIANLKRPDSFNCLEKEMYRFYGDTRDCRLFHYCSPGFTSRQVLDFRFVCEEGTAFDEQSQSCKHDVRKGLCPHRKW